MQDKKLATRAPIHQVDKFDYKSYKPSRQLLIMMMGYPGSGKSFFSRQLAETLGFKRFNADTIRTELYGRPDAQYFIKNTDKIVFGLLNERTEEALKDGYCVIRDHMHHRFHWRKETSRRQAESVGALQIITWIKTPPQLAHKRGLTRKLQKDQRVETCPKKMQSSIERHHNEIDLPTEDELYVEIDGRLNFTDQLKHFVEFCRQHDHKVETKK